MHLGYCTNTNVVCCSVKPQITSSISQVKHSGSSKTVEGRAKDACLNLNAMTSLFHLLNTKNELLEFIQLPLYSTVSIALI